MYCHVNKRSSADTCTPTLQTFLWCALVSFLAHQVEVKAASVEYMLGPPRASRPDTGTSADLNNRRGDMGPAADPPPPPVDDRPGALRPERLGCARVRRWRVRRCCFRSACNRACLCVCFSSDSLPPGKCAFCRLLLTVGSGSASVQLRLQPYSSSTASQRSASSDRPAQSMAQAMSCRYPCSALSRLIAACSAALVHGCEVGAPMCCASEEASGWAEAQDVVALDGATLDAAALSCAAACALSSAISTSR